MKIKNKGNKVRQYRLLLEDIKSRINYSSKQSEALMLGAIYMDGKIEITEFKPDTFIVNESNYRTRTFFFTKVEEEFHDDLKQAWHETFTDGRIDLKIIY